MPFRLYAAPAVECISMTPEALHFVWEMINRPQGVIMLVSIAIAAPFGILFFYWVQRRRIRPLTVWAILSVVTFCGSQIFPRNRSQAVELAITAPLICAVVTWLWFRLIGRGQEQPERQRAGPPL